MKSNKSLFISFEGPEASGKSSQILLLSKYFKENNIPFIISREPGGTDFAEKDVSEVNPLFKVFSAAKYLIFGRSLDEIK